MELIRTMFQPKSSMSPAKSIDKSNTLTSITSTSSNSRKRKHVQAAASPPKLTNGASNLSDDDYDYDDGGDRYAVDNVPPTKVARTSQGHGSPRAKGAEKRQGFTFEEVKGLLDELLAKDKKLLDSSVNVGLKNIDPSHCMVPGHRAEECKELIDKLVHNTRRIRTLEEVLQDIRASLNKRTYTDVILQSGRGAPPKRPPSAYLMYHRKRFKELQEEGETLASAIAKKVSEEWKNLSEHERAKYFRQHDREVKAYEENMKRMGLAKIKKPTRPKSAKSMFVKSKLIELGNKLPKDNAKLAKTKKKFEEEYDMAESAIKEYWIAMHNAEHKRYVEQREKFVEDNPHLDRDDIIKPRQSKARAKPPVPPKNAMKIYIERKTPEGLEGQELKDTEAKLRDKFERMSPKKQVKYIKRALRDKERYEAELEEFTQEHPDIKIPQHKPNVTKEQWRVYQVFAEHRPQAPAPTPYLHFCSSHIKNLENPDQAPTHRLQDASKAWKQLSEKEIVRVQKDHLEHIKRYIGDMEAWLAQQDEKRREQVFAEDPKSKPDYWRKKMIKVERSNAKSLRQAAKLHEQEQEQSLSESD